MGSRHVEMRAARWTALPLGAALAAGAAAAFAQPPARVKRTASAHVSSRATSAAALAYLSGKQSLTGAHAASVRDVSRDETGRPMLTLTTLNRGESLSVPAAGESGGFRAADLDRVAHLLRASGGEEHPIDPRTLSVVYRIETHFEAPEVRVVSGYRVPKPGSHSNHGRGRAIDLIVPGVADEEVARYVRSMGFVGVGVYPASEFVHVDVRPRSYFWVDYSGPHMHNHELPILGDLAARSDAAAVARGQAPIEPFAVATDVDRELRARGMRGVLATGTEDDDDLEN